MPPNHTTEGLDAARELRSERHDIGILLLSAHVEVEHALELLASGEGTGYLLKSRVTDVEGFVDTVRRIAEGGIGGGPRAGARAGRGHAARRSARAAHPARAGGARPDGRGTLERGHRQALWVTEGTVEKHVHSILQKLPIGAGDEDHRRVLAVLTFLDAG